MCWFVNLSQVGRNAGPVRRQNECGEMGHQEPETKGSLISSSAKSSHVMSTSGARGAESGRTRSSERGHVGQGENWLGFWLLVVVSWSTDSWRCVVTLVPRISNEVKGVCSNVCTGGEIGWVLGGEWKCRVCRGH